MLERSDHGPEIKSRRFQEKSNQIEIVFQLFHITIRYLWDSEISLEFSAKVGKKPEH